jgi:hypothetical protein
MVQSGLDGVNGVFHDVCVGRKTNKLFHHITEYLVCMLLGIYLLNYSKNVSDWVCVQFGLQIS